MKSSVCRHVSRVARALALLALLESMPAIAQAPDPDSSWLPEFGQRAASVLMESLIAIGHSESAQARTGAWFRAAFLQPQEFPVTANRWRDALPRYRFDPLITLTAVSDLYAAQFALPADCVIEPLTLPETLDEAMDQVESLSASSRSRYQQAVSRRTAERLRNGFAELQPMLLSQPWGGELSHSRQRQLRRQLRRLGELDKSGVICAARQWSSLLDPRWTSRLQTLLASDERAAAEIIRSRTTANGEIILGGSTDNNYQSDDLLFVADLGGDDIYSLDRTSAFDGSLQLLLDYSGNDRYESSGLSGVAGGLGAVSLSLDVAGDDYYQSRQWGLGAAVLGVAALVDLNGNDSYDADALSMGVAMYGVGLLVDAAGNDNYRLGATGQGLGLPEGLGLLLDESGDDHYVAGGVIPTSYGTPGLTDSWAQGVGLGFRDLAPGGLGIILDGSGEDDYDAASLSQGGGYYFGLGVQLDLGAGNDHYLGARYNFGWGAHGGAGYFYAESGNDHYRTRQIVAAGLAWDNALAFFHDVRGDDIYDLGEFSLAAAAHHSMAWFIDSGGVDRYLGASPAEAKTEGPNFALFVDRGDEENEFTEIEPRTGCTRLPDGGLMLLLGRNVTPIESGCHP